MPRVPAPEGERAAAAREENQEKEDGPDGPRASSEVGPNLHLQALQRSVDLDSSGHPTSAPDARPEECLSSTKLTCAIIDDPELDLNWPNTSLLRSFEAV